MMNETMGERLERIVEKYKLFLAQFSPITLFVGIKGAHDLKQLSVLNYILIFVPLLLPLILICWFCMLICKTFAFLLSLTTVIPIFLPLMIVVLALEILHLPFRFIHAACVAAVWPE